MAEDFNNSVSIEVDWKSAEKQLKKLESITKNGFNKGLKETLNEVIAPSGGKNMKKFALEQMRKKYTIKSDRVNKKIEVEKATQSKLSASVYTKGRPNSLTYFKHNPTENMVKKKGRKNAGVTKAQVYKKGSLETIPKAFVATVKAGKNGTHYGMFKTIPKSRHVPKKGAYAGKKYKRGGRKRADGTRSVAGKPYERYKIKSLYGPGASQMLYNEDVSQAIEKEMEERFDKAIQKAIDKVVQKAMK